MRIDTRSSLPSRVASWIVTMASAILVLGLVGPVHAAVFTVGPGPAATTQCQYQSVQDAIDAVALLPAPQQAQAVIRVAFTSPSDAHRKQVAAVADGVRLTLEGGYTSCTDDQPAGKTWLSGTGLDPVLEIDGDSDVTIRRIGLSGGGGGWGGGLRIRSSAALLDHVEISNNIGTADPYAPSGGGLHVDRSTVMFRDTRIHHNQAAMGGGIYCTSSILEGLGGNVIADNTATQNGGGLRLSGCDTRLVGGHDIARNVAINGGGLSVQESQVELRSNGAGLVRVRENRAEALPNGSGGSGGGMYWSAAEADLVDVVVTGNSADATSPFDGGGAMQLHGAQTVVRVRSRGKGCPEPCSSWSGNRARRGAAASLLYGRLEISGTKIEDHVHVDGASKSVAVFWSYSASGSLHLEGSTVSRNRADSLFDLRGDNHVLVVDSTLAVNDVDRAFAVRSGYQDLIGSVALYSSIVWEYAGTPTFVVEPGGTATGDCVMTNDVASKPAGASKWIFADPKLIDLFGGNLRLRGDSPAIDACGPMPQVPRLALGDLDGETRCVDNTSATNNGGICDLGADETRSFPLGLVFADGFESGGLGRWSTSS